MSHGTPETSSTKEMSCKSPSVNTGAKGEKCSLETKQSPNSNTTPAKMEDFPATGVNGSAANEVDRETSSLNPYN